MTTATSKQRGSRESSGDSARSGRLLLRMPRALHERLAARSDAAGLSLNQYIVETLARAIDGEGATDTPARSSEPPKSLRFALLANAVVVALAAATCVVLLVVAWH